MWDTLQKPPESCSDEMQTDAQWRCIHLAVTIVIGTGIAGIAALKELSGKHNVSEIVLVGDEDRLPYKRTKISKSIARGFSRDDFALQTAEWFSERKIDMRLGREVLAIHPKNRMVDLDDGTRLRWDQLIIATGAKARIPPIPGYDPSFCHTVRQAGDVEGLLAALDGKRSVLVVGTGVLGIEIAEQLWTAGHDVTSISGGNSVMPRELNRASECMMIDLMERAGIDLRLGTRVLSIKSGDRVVVRTTAGTLTADQLVFAVGSIPNTRLAVDAGIEVSDGILVNEFLKTSVEGIFAAGDVAQIRGGAISHLWHEAETQGRYAGLNAVGPPVPYPMEAFRLKCEVFGHCFFSIGRPDPNHAEGYRSLEDTGSTYRCFYFKDGRLSGVVMVDDAPRSKEYEAAVRKGLAEPEVREEFLS